MVRVGLDLPAKLADEHAERLDVRCAAGVPDLAEQPVVGAKNTWRDGERFQQPPFRRREMYLLGAAPDRPRAEVDRDAVDGEARAARLGRCAAQQGADP